MAQTTEIEMWAAVNAEGEYAVGADEEAAREKYEEDNGALSESGGFRLVKVTVTVPLPEPIEIAVEAVADEEPSAAAVA